MKQLVKSTLHALGIDVVRLPLPYTLGKHLQELLPKLDVSCVLDVGGNRGQYAELLREIGYRGWIASFEPMPASVEVLRQKAANDHAWLIYPFALGAESAQLDLHVYSNSQLNSLLAINHETKHIPAEESASAGTTSVPVVRLEDILPDIDRKVGPVSYFLKSDTQGYDLNVLKGAERILDRIQGLQVELALKPFYEGAPSYEQMMGAIRAYGYDATGFFPVAVDPDGTLVEVDYVSRRQLPS
jgi:FkbM family methyltransferase